MKVPPQYMLVSDAFYRAMQNVIKEQIKREKVCTPLGLWTLFPSLCKR